MENSAGNNSGLGNVSEKYFTFAQAPNELVLDCGKKLGPITLAYETYGDLNKDKTNAVLILHALSGDAHAAGVHKQDDKPGWWDSMIGPDKAFDTNKYFIICSNVIGGCRGSTGPGSINAQSNRPYGISFPLITISDMVKAQKELIDHLGIERLLSVAGGSMGGMQALQWVASFGSRVASCIPIATALKHSPQQIAFNEVGRQAVMADPDWQGGDYYGTGQPERGLAVARMIGHITYMSDQSMEEKFSRRLKDKDFSYTFASDFEVEGYLRYRGDSFVKRFDANSYLYITKAIDYFELKIEDLIPDAGVDTRFLVIAFKSDWLYPPHQSQDLVRQLKMRGAEASYCEISATYGHDSFLLEVDEQSRLIRQFLEHVK